MSDALFDLEPKWAEHWKGMPEFVQDDRESIGHVVVHFENLDDMKAFTQLTGLIVTEKTKGVFFPPSPPKPRRVWTSES